MNETEIKKRKLRENRGQYDKYGKGSDNEEND
jgi:hypothetical protein